MVCAIDFSASILMFRKVLLCVGWVDLHYFADTLPLEFADRKCPCSCPRAIGLVSSVRSFRKTGYCFDHSSTKNTQMC